MNSSGLHPFVLASYGYHCMNSEGLELLRIDERYDADDPADGIDEGDPWRPMNRFVHRPGLVGTIVRERGYSYASGTSISDRTLLYDAMGNVMGVSGAWGASTWDYDAFGNPTAPGVWPEMDSSGPKPRLTGKMLDADTGLYYFHARWYDPAVGRFVGRDKGAKQESTNCTTCISSVRRVPVGNVSQWYNAYSFAQSSPTALVDADGRADAIPDYAACVKQCLPDLAEVPDIPSVWEPNAHLYVCGDWIENPDTCHTGCVHDDQLGRHAANPQRSPGFKPPGWDPGTDTIPAMDHVTPDVMQCLFECAELE